MASQAFLELADARIYVCCQFKVWPVSMQCCVRHKFESCRLTEPRGSSNLATTSFPLIVSVFIASSPISPYVPASPHLKSSCGNSFKIREYISPCTGEAIDPRNILLRMPILSIVWCSQWLSQTDIFHQVSRSQVCNTAIFTQHNTVSVCIWPSLATIDAGVRAKCNWCIAKVTIWLAFVLF